MSGGGRAYEWLRLSLNSVIESHIHFVIIFYLNTGTFSRSCVFSVILFKKNRISAEEWKNHRDALMAFIKIEEKKALWKILAMGQPSNDTLINLFKTLTTERLENTYSLVGDNRFAIIEDTPNPYPHMSTKFIPIWIIKYANFANFQFVQVETKRLLIRNCPKWAGWTVMDNFDLVPVLFALGMLLEGQPKLWFESSLTAWSIIAFNFNDDHCNLSILAHLHNESMPLNICKRKTHYFTVYELNRLWDFIYLNIVKKKHWKVGG